MAVIRLGQPTPVLEPRRVRLDAAAMLALQRALADEGVEVPADLRVEVDPVAADLAGVDLDAELARARALLVEHDVLEGGAPVEAVVANVAAVVAAPRRVRTSLAGPDVNLLARHWVDARLGGSLVRQDQHFVLSLFDARSWGEEVLRLLPEPERADADRDPFTVPLEALGILAAVGDGVDVDTERAMGEFLDLDPDRVVEVRRWAGGVRAVLHVAVSPLGAGTLPPTLIWFLDRRGWWSTRVSPADREPRTVTVSPCGREDLPGALGALMSGVWV